jgi:hypothetical protein
VATAITALGINVIRVGGIDRADTAAKAAALMQGTFSDLPTVPDPESSKLNCNASGPQLPNTCTKPVGLFYRTDHVNVARGDDFADALTGGPHAAYVDNDDISRICMTSAEPPVGCAEAPMGGPTPILLAVTPSTLGTATSDYVKANSVTKLNGDVWPDGGITTAHVLGGVFAITPATATAVRDAMTGA